MITIKNYNDEIKLFWIFNQIEIGEGLIKKCE